MKNYNIKLLKFKGIKNKKVVADFKGGKITSDADSELASAATLSRFENSISKENLFEISKEFVEEFIRSQKSIPKKLVLDFDATDIEVHGNQENKFYHGYYDNYCFLPLYVYCGEKLLVSYLRHAHGDACFRHSWIILKLLVKRFREIWPKVKITLHIT